MESDIMKTSDLYKSIKYIKIYNKIDADINNISIDTRTIDKNDCYIGIKGQNFDGNLFYKEAFEKGASITILDNFSELLNNGSNIVLAPKNINKEIPHIILQFLSSFIFLLVLATLLAI